MRRREMLLALAGGVAAGACARLKHVGVARRNELVLCGGDEVFILSLGPEENPKFEKVWSWRAADDSNLPKALTSAFRSTDDCKPIEGGRKILISSSSGAVVVVERETRRAIFYASVINAHSIEALPGERIVACASVSDSSKGNRLVVFDVGAPDKEVFGDPLTSAHGVVWDAERRILWALGGDELRVYRLKDWKNPKANPKNELQTNVQAGAPTLVREASYRLPDSGGHDLSPIPGKSLLFVSAGLHCWYFDRDTRRFAPHDVLADALNIKCYSVNRSTGRIAYTQAEGSNWWTERVHFLSPPGLLHLPGQRLYKARWNA
jgi:hypothetical protein